VLEPTIVYGQIAGNKSDVCPSELQSRLLIIQNKYQFIYTDGSKESDRVGGYAVVWGMQYLTKYLPDVASIYTAERQTIYLGLCYSIGSTEDEFSISTCPQYFRTRLYLQTPKMGYSSPVGTELFWYSWQWSSR